MNLYFRLLWLLLNLPWAPKQSPLAINTLHVYTMPTDLDLNLHVNNGRYMTLMDLGRFQLMAICGLLKIVFKRRWMPVVGSAKVHFSRSANAFQKLTITTQIVYWDEKWIYLEQKIFKNKDKPNEELCVSALFKTLFTSKMGKIPTQEIISLLPDSIIQPKMPENIEFWIKSEKT